MRVLCKSGLAAKIQERAPESVIHLCGCSAPLHLPLSVSNSFLDRLLRTLLPQHTSCAMGGDRGDQNAIGEPQARSEACCRSPKTDSQARNQTCLPPSHPQTPPSPCWPTTMIVSCCFRFGGGTALQACRCCPTLHKLFSAAAALLCRFEHQRKIVKKKAGLSIMK